VLLMSNSRSNYDEHSQRRLHRVLEHIRRQPREEANSFDVLDWRPTYVRRQYHLFE